MKLELTFVKLREGAHIISIGDSLSQLKVFKIGYGAPILILSYNTHTTQYILNSTHKIWVRLG